MSKSVDAHTAIMYVGTDCNSVSRAGLKGKDRIMCEYAVLSERLHSRSRDDYVRVSNLQIAALEEGRVALNNIAVLVTGHFHAQGVRQCPQDT